MVKTMVISLGLWLRQRYDGFIKNKFDPKEFYIRSSDFDVNLMTALLVTDAFYYPDNETRFRDFPRLPTPVHAAPMDVDKLLYVDIACPRIAIETSKLHNIPEVQNFFRKNENLFHFVSEKSGANITSLEDFLDVYRTLAAERSYNLTIPSWAVQNYDEISTAAHFWFQYFSYSNELKRLRVGPVFELLTENMRKKSIGELSEQKMFMYSYQGFYTSAMLNTMGVFNGIEPPHSSSLIFELHQTGQNYFVKVLYQNDTTFQNPPLELTLPDCSLECPLSDFINLLKDFIPKDWEKECHSIDPISDPSYPSYTGNSENKNTDIQMAILRKTNTETIDFTAKK
ncbi:hypothetical protein Anas_01621 [Armadillidium nasatum]|uniref:acid phosphatase n=1 Tax=Armadillidium nasatum TaxID=96803 RepID=A0A5N5TNL8_9CRUS|nr:hypothetical protein Anas_01621 [Armadillidium nasatum]